MCILETYVNLNALGNRNKKLLKNRIEELSLIKNEPSSVLAYEIERTSNPTIVMKDILFILKELRISATQDQVSRIFCIYMSKENACKIALKNMQLERSSYLKICYIIFKRMKVNNYLLNAYFKLRLKKWIDKSEASINEVIGKLFNLEMDYISNKYVKFINSLSYTKQTMRKNKIQIFQLINEKKIYLRGHLINYIGAISWAKHNLHQAKQKEQVIYELNTKFSYKEMEKEIEVEQIDNEEYYLNIVNKIDEDVKIKEEQRKKKKRKKEREILDIFVENSIKLKRNLKFKKQMAELNKALDKMDEKKDYTDYEEMIESNRMNYILKCNDIESVESDDKIQEYCQYFKDKYNLPTTYPPFVAGFLFEENLASTNTSNAKLARRLRLRRIKMARIDNFVGYVNPTIEDIEEIIKDGAIFEELDYKLFTNEIWNHFSLSGVNKSPNKILGSKIFNLMLNGNYYDLKTLFQNNKITKTCFIQYYPFQNSFFNELKRRTNIKVDETKLVQYFEEMENFHYSHYNDIMELRNLYIKESDRVFIDRRDFEKNVKISIQERREEIVRNYNENNLERTRLRSGKRLLRRVKENVETINDNTFYSDAEKKVSMLFCTAVNNLIKAREINKKVLVDILNGIVSCSQEVRLNKLEKRTISSPQYRLSLTTVLDPNFLVCKQRLKILFPKIKNEVYSHNTSLINFVNALEILLIVD